MYVLPSEQCWAELHAFAIQLCDIKVAIMLLLASRLTKNISNNLFHFCSIADVKSDKSTERGEPMVLSVQQRGYPVLPPSHSGEGVLTGSGVWGGCCLSTALLQFSPQVSMQCPEPSDVGLPVGGHSGALPLFLQPPGSGQQHLLRGIIHIPAWLDFVLSQWLHLLFDESTSPARRVTSLILLKLPYQTIFFSESRTFFLCCML